MRKLYKLKKWYSLEDAAGRLTLTLDEPVTVQDIRQLMADGHLTAYWDLERRVAREIAPVTRIYSEGDGLFEAMRCLKEISNSCTKVYIEELEPQDEYVQEIEGLFKLDVQLVGAPSRWLRGVSANKESQYSSLDGTFVVGEDGRLWQLMASLSFDECSTYSKPKSPWNHPDNFYAKYDMPDASNIVITKEDIESFEAQFSEPIIAEKPLGTNERNTLLVLIAALCKSAGIDPASRTAAGDLTQLARADGINVDIDRDTVKDKLKQIPDALGARAK